MSDLDMDETARLYHGEYIKEIERLTAECNGHIEWIKSLADDVCAAESKAAKAHAERDALQAWLEHEVAVCEAAGDRAGTIAYSRALAKLEGREDD